MDALSTIAGLVLAVVGARLLVDGGSAVAKRFGIPSLVLGASVVAFGTSMPEWTVNVHSALGGNTDLALGNWCVLRFSESDNWIFTAVHDACLSPHYS